MSTSAITGASGSTNTSSTGDSLQAFRNADFLKIMMAEVTNQDPLQPSDTSKMVDNLQKLQDLANSTYSKFRADIKWANDLMGQTVQVQQQSIDEKKATSQKDKGLKPDVGFGLVNGR
jgi:flagellar hook assembly protein FlgD